MSEQEARKLISGLTREEKIALRELLIQLRENRKKNASAEVVATAEILHCAQDDKSLGAEGICPSSVSGAASFSPKGRSLKQRAEVKAG